MTDEITIQELDRLDLVVVMDNETDTLSSVAVPEQRSEAVSILERHDPEFHTPLGPATSVFDHLCYACHGYSVLATATKDEQSATVLFDVGPDGDLWLANADRLGIELDRIDELFLSHWHWDHSGGLTTVAGEIVRARSAASMPPPIVNVHPDRPGRRGVRLADSRIMLLPPDPALDALAATGATMRYEPNPHGVGGGLFVGSGEIPRSTSYETGLSGHITDTGDGFFEDPLILDERLLATRVRGRGTTLLSACSHAGIVNAAACAIALAGPGLDLVLGGYHLAGFGMESRIGPTLVDLEEMAPRLVAPGHCTGWRAKSALAELFGATDRFVPSVVGTRYRLAAHDSESGVATDRFAEKVVGRDSTGHHVPLASCSVTTMYE